MVDYTLLRKRRKELGLTQLQVAARFGFCTSYLSMVEAGEFTPSVDNLAKLMRILGLKFEEIYEYEEDA